MSFSVLSMVYLKGTVSRYFHSSFFCSDKIVFSFKENLKIIVFWGRKTPKEVIIDQN